MADRSNINLNAYATEGQNVGTGTGVFAGKSGVSTLDFKSISVLGTGLSITGDSNNVIISGTTGGASSWGTITGTLSNQTDLNNALTGITSDLSTVSGQTDTNTSNIALKLNTSVFSGYTATTENTLTGITNDLSTVSGQTVTNAADIVTLSGKTIDNLQSGIFEYDVACETFKPYSAFTAGSFYYGAAAFQPTGTTDLNFDGILTVSEVHLSTGSTHTTHTKGDIYWDDADQTVAITQNDAATVTQQVGQESYVFVKNNTGVGVNNGQVVYINGADGDRPTIALARASSSDGNIVGATIGLVTEDILNGETGFVTSFGLVKGLNITDPAGTIIWVSTSTSGGTQITKPTLPDYAIKVGIITKTDGVDGRILVNVHNQTDLTGVTVTTNNGLTKTGNNIQLGGALTKDTSISTVGYGFGALGTCCTYLATYNGTDLARIITDSGHTITMDVRDNIGGVCQSIVMDMNDGNGIRVVESIDNIGFQYGADYSTNGASLPRWIPDNSYVTGFTTGTSPYLPKYGTSGIVDSHVFETGTTLNAIPICGLATCNPIGLHAMVFNCSAQKLAFSYSTGSFSGPKISADTTDTLRLTGSYMIMTATNHIKINTSGSANSEMIIDKITCNVKDLTYVGGDGYGQGNIGISVGLIAGDGRSTFNTAGGDILLKPGVGDGSGADGDVYICRLQAKTTETAVLHIDNLGKLSTGVTDTIGWSCDSNCSTIIGCGTPAYSPTIDRNTAVGVDALKNVTTGYENVAIGWKALCGAVNACWNIAIGGGALALNTGGTQNVALGYQALAKNVTGQGNFAVGYQTLCSNTIGGSNFGYGSQSLVSNVSGDFNIGIGNFTLQDNVAGVSNIAMGACALANTTGSSNISLGYFSTVLNVSGQYNVALGYQALRFNESGNDNVVLGGHAGCRMCGDDNIALGSCAMRGTLGSTGSNNVAIGDTSLYSNTSGQQNIALGTESLAKNAGGGCNVALGWQSLCNATSGFRNIAIGYRAIYGTAAQIGGVANVAIGAQTLYCNTTSVNNVAIGIISMYNTTSGGGNVAIGAYAFCDNTIGSGNIAIGQSAMRYATEGLNNIGIGANSLGNNINGQSNIAIGTYAIGSCDNSGSTNISIGNYSMCLNTTGEYNTALGNQALNRNTTGFYNVGIGPEAGMLNRNSSCNISVGFRAGRQNTDGIENIAIGTCALYLNTVGNKNVVIGNYAALSETGDSKLHIANCADCSLICGDFVNKTLAVDGVFYPGSYNCVDVSCSGLPPASGHTGGMIHVADISVMAWSNGVNWLDFIDNNPI